MKYTYADKTDLFDHYRTARNENDIEGMRSAVYHMQKAGLIVPKPIYRQLKKYW